MRKLEDLGRRRRSYATVKRPREKEELCVS